MGVFFQKGRGIPALAPLTPYLRHLSVLFPCGIPQAITLPIQSPSSRRGVWFRVLCGALRRHNRDRDEDSL